MNDLEDRLRTSLHDLADELPPSPHARADLERRLSRRRPRRTLVLAAAAAAVVIAGVAIPVALNQDAGPPGGRTATTPPTTSDSLSGVIAGPVEIGEFTRDGVRWSEVLTIEAGEAGRTMVCARQIAPNHPHSGNGGCMTTPLTWPEPPDNGTPPAGLGWVRQSYIIPDSMPNQWTVVTAPQVVTLEFRRPDSTMVPAELKLETPELKVFLVEMEGGPAAATGFTAMDAAGNALESAIE